MNLFKIILLIIVATSVFSKQKLKIVPDSIMVYAKANHIKYGLSIQATIAIGVVESGWWTSRGYLVKKNCFGIMNSNNTIKQYNSYKQCFDDFARIITTKSIYANAYKNRNSDIEFIKNLKRWSILKEKYIDKVLLVIRNYKFK